MTAGANGIEVNLLELVPVRTCRWYVSSETGNCIIRKKRFVGGPSRYQRLFMRLLHRDDFVKVRLDERGSYLFRLMNGKRNVGTIVKMAKNRFGSDIEPVRPRISIMLQNMESNGLINLRRE